jgi:hypothetical protein
MVVSGPRVFGHVPLLPLTRLLQGSLVGPHGSFDSRRSLLYHTAVLLILHSVGIMHTPAGFPWWATFFPAARSSRKSARAGGVSSTGSSRDRKTCGDERRRGRQDIQCSYGKSIWRTIDDGNRQIADKRQRSTKSFPTTGSSNTWVAGGGAQCAGLEICYLHGPMPVTPRALGAGSPR